MATDGGSETSDVGGLDWTVEVHSMSWKTNRSRRGWSPSRSTATQVKSRWNEGRDGSGLGLSGSTLLASVKLKSKRCGRGGNKDCS